MSAYIGTFIDENVRDDLMRSSRYYYTLATVLEYVGTVGCEMGLCEQRYSASIAQRWVYPLIRISM